jgi:macrolide transport system ATP-binding/permease protein
MHIIGLLDSPDTGSYRFQGREVSALADDELAEFRSSRIGFVFQQFNLLARASAEENVALPHVYCCDAGPHKKPAALLSAVGLEARTGHTPNELSGGEQQRVAIARALANSPSIVVADEPTGNLDTKTSGEIMNLLEDLHRRGMTIVLVTHDPEVAARANRVIRMRDGTVESDSLNKVVEAASEPTERQVESEGHTGLGKGWLSAARRSAVLGKEAVRALLAHKARAGLSMLGVLIGVAAVIAMMALADGASMAIEKTVSDLGSNLLVVRPGASQARGVSLEAGSVTRLTEEDADALAGEVRCITRASAIVFGKGQTVHGSRNWRTQVFGVTPDYFDARAYEATSGRLFSHIEDRKSERVVVLGQTVKEALFGSANPVGSYIKINRSRFLVIGVLSEKGASLRGDQDDAVVVPLNTAMRRLFGKRYVDVIEAEVDAAENIAIAKDRISTILRRRHRIAADEDSAFQIMDLSEIQDTLNSTMKTMSWLLGAIAAISLLVGGIGIMNIMLVSVVERTREIGLRKAVGARRKEILSQFLTESLAIGLVGGAEGIVVGWLIALGMARLAGWTATVTLETVLLAFLFSACVGVVFGLWPAHKAAQLNPIEALRFE